MGAVAEQHYNTEYDWRTRRNQLHKIHTGRPLNGFGRPSDLTRLADRLERADRVSDCRHMTGQMLVEWHGEGAPIAFYNGVWAKGICIDFLVFTWKGVFCVWSVDCRWTVNQAAMVQPARIQIQDEIVSPGWPGKVEAVFHSPREETGWHRHMLVHEASNEPVEIVVMRGRIDEILYNWEPFNGIALDPEWIAWLCQAATPRWWKSAEGRETMPRIPREEHL